MDHNQLSGQLKEHALKSPVKPAIVYRDHTLTYEQLEKETDKVTRAIAAAGLTPGDSAGIWLPHGIESVISLLACLRAGVTCQPMEGRLAQLASPRLLITNAAEQDKARALFDNKNSAPSLLLVELGQAPQCYSANGETLQEVHLTEGSEAEVVKSESYVSHWHLTVSGKVVKGSAQALTHFVSWFTETFDLKSNSRGILLHPLSCELSLLEILATVRAGGTLYIPAKASGQDLASLHTELVEQKVTWAFLSNEVFSGLGRLNMGVLGLDLVLTGEGKPLTGQDVNRWQQALGDRCRVVNTLVLPEATMFRTYHEVTETSGGEKPLPYGHPVDKSFTAILTEGQLCKPLEEGELYIKTPHLSYGYAEDDRNEVFVQNPLTSQKDLLLRTGLKGYYLKNRSVMPGSPVENGTGNSQNNHAGITALPAADDYTLSHAQKRLWLLDQMQEGFYAYNMFAGYEMEGELNVTAFQKAFETLVERHEILRTTFRVRSGEPRQVIHEAKSFDFRMSYEDMRDGYSEDKVEAKAADESRYALDLETGPLFRATLLRTHDRKFVFLLVMHHIVSDGWSLNVLVKEVLMLYDAYRHSLPEPLNPLSIQYKDYAAWQKNELEEEEADNHKEFWQNLFAGEVSILDIPADYPRPMAKDYKGKTIEGSISRVILEKLYYLGHRNGATLFVTLQAALDAFLYRYTGQSDITLVTPIAGRPHPDLEDQIGFYINMLPLRATFKGEDSFISLLNQVRNTTFSAYEHQVYPFDKIIEDIDLGRDMARSPLSDVCIVLQNTSNTNEGKAIAGVEVKPKSIDNDISKYDLTWTFTELDQELHFMVNYATSLFTEERIRHMMDLFANMLTAIANTPGEEVDRLPLLSEEERYKVTRDFNPSPSAYPSDKTVGELFTEQVAKTPDRVALIHEGQQHTYRELDRVSDWLAAYLQTEYKVEKGEKIALIFDRNDHLVISTLAVLKAGAVYVPVDPKFPDQRKEFILESTGCKTLISQSDYLFDMPYFSGNMFATDIQLDMLEEATPEPAGLTAEDPAYIMFTSGSTGQPKGVVVPHRAIVRLVKNTGYIELSEASRLLLTGAISFDATTFEIWGMLLNGGTLTLVSEDTLMDPVRLKQAMHENEINTLWITTGFFNQLVDDDPEIFTPVKQLITGGERISIPHVNRIRELLPGLTLINGYGPTENTTFSTCHRIEKSYKVDIPLGKAITNSTAYILDSRLQPVPVGVPGEICVGGDGLAIGYLGNEELTREKFVPHPFTEGERLYRTGDLGRWTQDGEIQFIGRKDFQVKIRGFRVEPGEIEAAMEEVDGLLEKVVVARQDNAGVKHLVAYFTAEDALTTEALKAHLQKDLPEHAVPSVFVRMERMPLTNNGKIDRRKLPEPQEPEDEKIIVEPETTMEKALAAIWLEVLEVKQISADDNFFEVGGHSLKATQVISRLHKKHNLKVDLRDIFGNPVLGELAAFLDKEVKADATSIIPKTEKRPHYPLSSAQKRLWLVAQASPESSAYNMPVAYELAGDLDADRLEKVLADIVARHQSFRTRFGTHENGEPYQQVVEIADLPFTLGRHDLRETSDPEHEAKKHITLRADYRFDLEKGPLFKADLYRLEDQRQILLLNMHHIISDGWSLEVLASEVFELYKAYSQGDENPLKPLNIQYPDYSEWHNREMEGQTGHELKAFWKEKLRGELPVLEMPADYVRPAFKTYDGKAVKSTLDATTLASLKHLGENAGATLFTTLSALTKALLYRYTGQEDIILGTVVAGRDHFQLEDQIGFYVNTLPLRSTFSGNDSVEGFIEQEKQNILEAFRHQAYPLDRMVDDLSLTSDPSRSPLFDALIVLQNNDLKKKVDRIEGMDIRTLSTELTTSKYDLEFNFAENSSGGLNLTLTYNTALFKKETIERLQRHLVNYLSKACEAPSLKLHEVNYLEDQEKETLLQTWTKAKADYPSHRSVTGLFMDQVEKRPAHTALITPERAISYAGLDKESSDLASLLVREYGVKKGDCVGLLAKRSVGYITSLLAILKAGALYVPLDPAFPEARKSFILQDTQCRIVLAEPEYADELKDDRVRVVKLQGEPDSTDSEPEFTPVPSTPGDLAYIMYTSGSTGKPKGVQITNRGIVRLVKECNYLDLHPDSRLLMNGAVAFDASTFEVWGMLLNGGSIVLVDNDILLHPEALREAMHTYDVNTFWITTGYFNQLADVQPEVFAHVKQMVTGGERMSIPHVNKIRKLYPGLKLNNVYGPTENTTFSLYHHLTADNVTRDVPLGKPISNSSVYVLDDHLNPIPIGVKGEICVGGDGLAAGYLNRKDLTAGKFVQLPADPSEMIYRTGDMGRWNEHGEVEFLGRGDFQVKIRGFRVETGEIEAVMEKVTGIKDKLVRAFKDKDGVNHLVAYYTAGPAFEEDNLKEAMKSQLPEYMVPASFIRLDEMPMNTSGKTDLKALPEPGFEANTTEYAEPVTDTEIQLAAIWANVLGVNKVGREDSFFNLGGHSLKATQIVSRIYKQLQAKITIRDIYTCPTLRELAACLDKLVNTRGYQSIPKAPEAETYPATHAQKRMWLLEQFEDGNLQAFNMPSAYYLEGDLDAEAFEKSFESIIRRHDSLRTVFISEAGEPRQKVISAGQFDFPFEFTDLSEKENGEEIAHEWAEAEVSTPFDLATGPLIRVRLLKLEDRKHLLLMTLHHIISDGWSMQVFTRELFDGYNDILAGKSDAPPPPAIQYTDYAVWMEQQLSGEKLEQHRTFWLNEFSGTIPVLNLPTDRPRPRVQTHKGSVEAYLYPAEMTDKLSTLSGDEQASLYMALMAGIDILFYKYTGQTDMVFGSPIAGRHHDELEPLIGLFLNTLPIRSRFSSGMSFRQLLEEVKSYTLGAFEHQVYPVDLLIDELNVPRDLSRSPLFDVLVVLQNMSAQKAAAPMRQLEISTASQELTASKFDLSFYFSEGEEGIVLGLEYNTDLYDQSTIRRMMSHLHRILEAVIHDPDKPIDRIDLLNAEERSALEAYSRGDSALRHDFIPVVDLIGKHRNRANTALRSGEVSLSYAELMQLSDKVAVHILSSGLQKGETVAIFAERNERMVAAMLGALKAGTPYLPLDTEYPAARVEAILKDAGVKLILTDSASSGLLTEAGAGTPTLLLDQLPAAAESATYPEIDPDDAAYILYTSGSTGVPKGVVVSHQATSGYAQFAADYFGMTQEDVVAQQASLTFDTSVEEIFPILIAGGTLSVAREGGRDIEALTSLIEHHKCTILSTTPLVIRELNKTPERLSSLRILISGGDRLRQDHIDKLPESLAIYNTYGPTEATVCATYHRITDRSRTDLIGKPVAGKRIYILGAGDRLQPVGVPGEICIAGEGLAQGYLNREEQTAEAFVADPFRAGERMYRTGDMGRWTAEGEIRFEGRRDDQVKIRGHRVEPAEVETVLAGHDAVQEAVVLVIFSGNDTALTAFVQSEDDVDAQTLRNHLLRRLLAYMVPATIRTLDKFPRNTAGKVDRRALSEIASSETTGFKPHVAPRTESEEQVAAIWKAILTLEEEVSVTESFFDIGGDSIKLVKLRRELESLTGMEIKVAKLFELHTIEAIAGWLDERTGSEKESTEIVSF